MSWSMGRRRIFISFVAFFVLVIFAVDKGTPALMNHLTIVEAEKLSLHWLDAYSKTNELPGQPDQNEEDLSGLIDQIFTPKHENHHYDASAASSPEQSDFSINNSFNSVLGYRICTTPTRCPISGGSPVQNSHLTSEEFRSFREALTLAKIDAFLNASAAKHDQRIVTVMVPLLRDNKPQAVAIIDVVRSEFEQALYEGIQQAAIFTAVVISLISLGTILMLLNMDGKRRDAETEASFLALHDGLTGLPNRLQFNTILKQCFEKAKANKERLAILRINIDGFKDTNEIFGHSAGDHVLKSVGQTLKTNAGGQAFVAHLSGDEFAILLKSLEHENEIIRLCNAILEIQQQPIFFKGKHISTSLSIGIAEYPLDCDSPEDLLKHAEFALDRAKAIGPGQFNFFTQELNKEMQRRRKLKIELSQALKHNQLQMHYQPQVDTASNTLTGFEALIRWPHEKEGFIPPSEFIPIAEQNGMISEIGYWTLQTACQEAANWPENHTIAVNLSPIMFNDGDLVERIKDTLAKTGLDPRRLEIEITENVLLDDSNHISSQLVTIRNLGIGIAMDDFGTGYSSLSYLTRIPFTKIKIDQSFIRGLDDGKNIDSIIHAIVGIGDSLDVSIIAEGVESTDQLLRLNAAGCYIIQGYLFGKPSSKPALDLDPISRIAKQPVHKELRSKIEAGMNKAVGFN